MTATPRVAVLMAVLVAAANGAGTAGCRGTDGRHAVIRITGSDTMVNLVQTWAEHYAAVQPEVSVQVAGGGTGVGIAALIDGLADVAAAGRRIRTDEIRPLPISTRSSSPPCGTSRSGTT